MWFETSVLLESTLLILISNIRKTYNYSFGDSTDRTR